MSGNSLTFTNNTGLFSSRKRLFGFFTIFLLLSSIIAICAYKIVKVGEKTQISPPSDFLISLKNDFRLPHNLKPYKYNLDLTPHLNPAKNWSFSGKIKILLNCHESTHRILFHSKNLTIFEKSVRVYEIDEPRNTGINNNETISGNVTKIEVTDKNLKYFDILMQMSDPGKDFYLIVVNETLKIGGKYGIELEYGGVLNDELVGFYRSSYIDKTSNEKRWIASTQFSPTDARRAFPCFDEPSFKSIFEISITRPSGLRSISNMPLIKTQPSNETSGWFQDFFKPTLPMSTYLVGFGVNDFDEKFSDPKLSGPLFSIWGRRDAVSQTEYASIVGPKVLTFFENYFGIKFPLEKINMIGVPEHRFNAMENWGMITYRETAIFYDPNYSSEINKRSIAYVISHELAHQWFGNLVTPSWWSDLWLKEGFATYVGYLGADHVAEEWVGIDEVSDLQKVFRMDALKSSHEISIPVNHPNEINQIFDSISYLKGSAIIRMMDHFTTHKTFKTSLRNYLNKWKFNNTNQNDLWESVTEEAHKDGTLRSDLTVKEIMDTWTLQKGYPVLQVTRNYLAENATLTFTQRKFEMNIKGVNNTSSSKWYIPILYSTPYSNATSNFWLLHNETSIEKTVPNLASDDWILVNSGSVGYYRVNYDIENWMLLANALYSSHEDIPITTRASLLDDSFSLSYASTLPYELTFNISLYLLNEEDYLPWKSYFDNMGIVYGLVEGEEGEELFRSYLAEMVIREYDRVGFVEKSTESPVEKSHRAQILNWACLSGHSDCILKSLVLFQHFMRQNSSLNMIPVNIRSVVYCNAIKNGTNKEWDFLKDLYLKTNVGTEKERILYALSCSKNQTVLESLINESVTPNSFIRKQDSRNVLIRVASSSGLGMRLTFKFILDEWDKIRKYFGAGLSIDKLINDAIGVRLKTEDDLKKLKCFRDDKKSELGFGARAVDQAIEIVENNIEWRKNNYDTVIKWLEMRAWKV